MTNRHSSSSESPERTLNRQESSDDHWHARHDKLFKPVRNIDSERRSRVINDIKAERKALVKFKSEYPIEKSMQMINDFLKVRAAQRKVETQKLATQRRRTLEGLSTEERHDHRLQQ
jgi:hypothetical protein